uniref:EGF-like domain-containing protein n=1 Tax=Sander lucioperca TaxID=283035 RepID=A0A8C9ZJF2_SANLU
GMTDVMTLNGPAVAKFPWMIVCTQPSFAGHSAQKEINNLGYTVHIKKYLLPIPAVCNPRCQNYGVCVAPNSCDCPPGYPGLGCSAMCSPPCAHGGSCMRWNKCLCPPGWTGAGCHTGTSPLTLKDNSDEDGACVRLSCCTSSCKMVTSFCFLSAVCELPCANGGRCVGPDTCQCPSDYTGPQCLLRE